MQLRYVDVSYDVNVLGSSHDLLYHILEDFGLSDKVSQDCEIELLELCGVVWIEKPPPRLSLIVR